MSRDYEQRALDAAASAILAGLDRNPGLQREALRDLDPRHVDELFKADDRARGRS